MRRPASSTSKTNITADGLDIRTFTIKPGELLRFSLGTFSKLSPEPTFRVVYHDHDLESPNVVTHDDVSLDRSRKRYEVIRHFQSFSQVPHTITVRFASVADKELRLPD